MSELNNEILGYLHHRYKSEHNKLLERALSRIQELESQARWIPVSERLPDAHEWYLVSENTTDDTIVNMGFFDAVADSDGHVWIVGDGDSCGVTHWMPLPEPPKDTQ